MSWTSDTATDFADLLVRLDSFLVDHGHSLPPAYTGTGTGALSGVIGSTTTVQETITVSFTNATDFTVTGSVTGAMGTGVVGTAFTHARLGFLVSAGDTAWASGDTISWVMTPTWTRCRLFGGRAHFASPNFDVSKVVDGSSSTYANPLATALPQHAGIKLLRAVEVRSIRITIYTTPGNGPRDYAVQYSDTGADGSWTTASSFAAQTWSLSLEQRVHDVAACGPHLYWRLLITSANGSNVDLSELTFYLGTGGNRLDAIPWYGDAIWCAPGNGSQDQIFTGAKLKWNSVGAYWCWKLAGFTGYVPGNTFENQPGFSGGHAYLSLWDAPIPHWLVADGKCWKVLAKISSLYEQGYAGFYDSYMAPGGNPYPLLVGGSMGFLGSADPEDTSSAYRYAVADETHRAWWCPGGDTNSNSWGTASFRRVDGTWMTITGNNQSASPLTSVRAYWWPTANRGALTPQMQDLRLNLDGSVMMIPLILHDAISIYGEPDGVMTLCGNNQSVENIINVSRVQWLVMQNIARVGVQDYAAYRLS